MCVNSVQAFLGSEGLVRVFFYCSSDGNSKKFASSKIHFPTLLMWQENQGKCETHVLLFTSICYERKHVSDLSMLVFCFRSQTFMVYLRTTKVHSNQRFQGTHSTLSTPEIPPVNSPHTFGFPIVKYPPCPQNSTIVSPPPLQKS